MRNTLFNKVFGSCNIKALNNPLYMRLYRCAKNGGGIVGMPIEGSNIMQPPIEISGKDLKVIQKKFGIK